MADCKIVNSLQAGSQVSNGLGQGIKFVHTYLPLVESGTPHVRLCTGLIA